MSAVTVLGYLQECNDCFTTALLAEPTPGWTCRGCTGEPVDQEDPMERAYAAVRQFDIYVVLDGPILVGASARLQGLRSFGPTGLRGSQRSSAALPERTQTGASGAVCGMKSMRASKS